MNYLAATSLVGQNAATFLQGYVTNDMAELSESIAKPTAITDIKGRVVANGWVYGDSDGVHLIVHESTVEIVHAHLAKYLVFANAKFSEDVQRVDLIDSDIDSITVSPFCWRVMSPVTSEPKYPSMIVSEGFGLVTEATSGKFLPQMLGVTEINAVSFTKGCYLGQEIVARAEHRGQVKRHLFRYTWQGTELKPGDAVISGDRVKGTVITCDSSQALVVLGSNSPTLEALNASLELI